MKSLEELKNDGILREHNLETYRQVEELFAENDRVALVQATGTGKSFIAIQWLFDNCLMNGKRVLYLTSSDAIREQFNRNMSSVSIDKDSVFSIDELLYHKLLRLKDEDFEALKYDYIILDEFHRVGAEKWGKAVAKLLISSSILIQNSAPNTPQPLA